MIKTNEFLFTKGLYFSILLKSALRRNLWVFTFLIVIILYQATKGTNNVFWILLSLLAVYYFYLVIRCWIHSNSKINKLFFSPRSFEIDNRTINVIF